MAFTKALISCFALALLLSNTFTEAREFVLAGKVSWGIPSSPDVITNWSQRIRFQIGDSVVFKYDGKSDSVLEVTKENYDACNTASPLNTFNDGNTKIDLNRSGGFYYISGAEGHCAKGEKIAIWVMSDKHHGGHHAAPVVPTPVTPTVDIPTESPLSSPAPAPNAPAPAPHNGGSSLKAGFIGAMIVGSLALF